MNRNNIRKVFVGLLLAGLFWVQPAYADAAHADTARPSEQSSAAKIQKYGMTPITGSLIRNGTWDITVNSSSRFFRIHSCALTVNNGIMVARLTMESSSYTLLYPGTAREAAEAEYNAYTEASENDGWTEFTIPVPALNTPVDCAAFSKKKKKWYDRQLLFDASTLPKEALDGLEIPDYDLIEEGLKALENIGEATTDFSELNSASEPESEIQTSDLTDDISNGAIHSDLEDGRYSVSVVMTGGSGRASVGTPALLEVKEGKAYVQLLWSSSHYDWIRVGDVTYQNEAEEGANSVFTIPVPAFDQSIPIVADTTAMGEPVAVSYSLTFYRDSVGDEGLIPQVAAKRVVIFAAAIITAGFFLNLFVKMRRRQ